MKMFNSLIKSILLHAAEMELEGGRKNGKDSREVYQMGFRFQYAAKEDGIKLKQKKAKEW